VNHRIAKSSHPSTPQHSNTNLERKRQTQENTREKRTHAKMKLLTLNFLCCARKTCKTNPAAFPLHPKDAELEQVEAEINPLLIQNMLPRINWEALKTISQEVRIFLLQTSNPLTLLSRGFTDSN
jgi:hypothetical protein